MWTILQKEDLNSFLNTHNELKYFDKEFLLHEAEDYYILPRFFKQQFPFDKLHEHEDKNFAAETIDIEFNGELRDYQKEGAEQLELLYNYNGEINGLFKAHPGYGKTCVGAWTTCMTKQKTLIILDNNILVEQWRDAYLNFTNLCEDDIGSFQGGTAELDKPVVITMVQTLIAKQKSGMKEWYAKIRDAGFGLVHYDEVHATASGPRYALASLFINTRNVIGWSATPYAHGINEILLTNCIGKLIYSAKEYETVPTINFVKYNSGLGGKHSYRISKSADYVRMIAYYNSIIWKSQPYLDKIYDVTAHLEKKGHCTLIIASTIKQIDAIVKHLKSKGLDAIPFHASDRELDREKDRILVGTQKFVSKGFDYDELSALVYACQLKGKISLIQTIGRVLRRKPGKLDPCIYDIIDTAFGDTFVGTIMTKKKILKAEFGKNLKINEDFRIITEDQHQEEVWQAEGYLLEEI